MSWWSDHVVPRLVDVTCGAEATGPLRAAACAPLAGRVLEIGFGSGLNLPHHPAAVTEVLAVEPSDLAWRLAGPRLEDARPRVTRVGRDGHHLDLPTGSVDAVLLTFTLCTVAEADRVLAEARRVLRHEGRLSFVEHGLAPDPHVVQWQRRLEPLQRRLAGGCHLTRDPAAAVRRAGFDVEVQARYLPGPALAHPFTYVYAGEAVPA